MNKGQYVATEEVTEGAIIGKDLQKCTYKFAIKRHLQLKVARNYTDKILKLTTKEEVI